MFLIINYFPVIKWKFIPHLSCTNWKMFLHFFKTFYKIIIAVMTFSNSLNNCFFFSLRVVFSALAKNAKEISYAKKHSISWVSSKVGLYTVSIGMNSFFSFRFKWLLKVSYLLNFWTKQAESSFLFSFFSFNFFLTRYLNLFLRS